MGGFDSRRYELVWVIEGSGEPKPVLVSTVDMSRLLSTSSISCPDAVRPFSGFFYSPPLPSMLWILTTQIQTKKSGTTNWTTKSLTICMVNINPRRLELKIADVPLSLSSPFQFSTTPNRPCLSSSPSPSPSHHPSFRVLHVH